MRCLKKYSLYLLAFLLIFNSCQKQKNENEEEIRQSVKSYEDAYNQADAKALAALWAEDAKFVNAQSNQIVSGRETIDQLFQTFFQNNPGAKLQLTIDSISFPSDHQALESGIATIKQNEKILTQTAYKAIYQKQNGKWLLAELREADYYGPSSQNEHLKELEWLAGNWIDEDEDISIEINSKWDKYKNFLFQKFSKSVENNFDLEGMQIIGWDPVDKRIHSWFFDSDGAFGEGSWKKMNDRWFVETSYTLRDGQRASALQIYTPVDQDHYTWQSTGREIGGELLPNLDPVTIVRKKG